eukprot:6207378-Pleurochrysis_carterae.AAC.4
MESPAPPPACLPHAASNDPCARHRARVTERASPSQGYMNDEAPDEVDPDVFRSSTCLLEPLELMYRSLIAVGDSKVRGACSHSSPQAGAA